MCIKVFACLVVVSRACVLHLKKRKIEEAKEVAEIEIEQTEEKLHKSRLFGVRFAHLHFFFFFSLLCADCAIFEPLLCYLLLFVLFCCVSFSASLGFCISHSKVLINFSFDQFNKFLVVCQLKLNLCIWL